MFKVATPNKTNSKSNDAHLFNKGKKEQAFIQPKLKVGKPGDKYEVEADNVAEKVVSKNEQTTNPTFFTPTATPAVQTKEDTEVQEKPIADSITPTVQLEATEEAQIKEEEAQMMQDEDVQKQEEEDTVQAKEDEDVQKQEEEESVQAMEEEEAVQSKEEEEAQTKEEEEPVQAMEDETAQSKEEEDVQKQEEEAIQKEEEEEEEAVQAKLSVSKPKKATIAGRIKKAKGKGSKMPTGLKNNMEQGFGADFSNVNIHTDSESESMNKDLGAKAFTNKNDIFFNKNKFNPGTKEGQTLVAHELTHTIQQGASKPKSPKELAKQKLNDKAPQGDLNKATAINNETVGDVAVKGKAGELKEAAKEKVTDKKEAIKEKGKKGAKKAVAHTTPRNPKEDPNFKKLEGRVDTTAKEQQAHEPAEASAASAQSAAVSPANERESMAQSSQVDEMDNAEAGEFKAEDFKAKLMERIENMQLPANEEEADDFENNNNIDEVSAAATQDVQGEQTQAAGPIEQTSQKEPNTDAVPEREITPLPEAPIGSQPPSVNPNKAMPPKRGDAEVSQPLQDNMQDVDQQMADNEITDEQLAKSNEPSFTGALASKDQAKENTETAPSAFRKKEQGVLQNAKVNADKKGQTAISNIHGDRATSLNQVVGQQQKTGTSDTAERAKIAGEINTIYETTKTDVEKILGDLDTSVAKLFTAGGIIAKLKFEAYVARKMSAYKRERYSGISGALTWVGDAFTGLPDEVNQFFTDGRQVYIDYMDTVITKIAQLVANKLNEAKTRVTKGKQDVQNYVTSLPDNLQKIGKQAAEDITSKFDELEDSVNSKQDELIDSLAEQYMEGLNAVDARIEEMKAANRGLIDMALGAINGVIETIKKLRDLITTLLAEIQNALDVIMEDPIGFVSTLFDGVGKGIDMFMANIQKHMLGGFVTWLTGAMGPVGITIPDNLFSLKGIFNLVMQVLGLGWDFMRKKAVLLMGEPMVAAMEKGFEMFQIIRTQGVSGMWEYIKEQFTDLKETIIESIKSMLITQVIEAGIKWLLSLLIPGAGFIKAIMAIKDLIVFFVESAIMLIPSLIEAIKSLASGNVGGVAKAIEKGLSMLLPLVISLFAKLIGLGGLVKKVQKIIKKVRKRIDRAVTKMIKKAKAKFKKLVKKGKAKVKGAIDYIKTFLGIKKGYKNASGKNHKIFFEKKGNSVRLVRKSVKKVMEDYFIEVETGIKTLPDADRPKYNTFLTQAKAHAKIINDKRIEASKSDRVKRNQLSKGTAETVKKEMVKLANVIANFPEDWADPSKGSKVVPESYYIYSSPVQTQKTDNIASVNAGDGQGSIGHFVSMKAGPDVGSKAGYSSGLYDYLKNKLYRNVVQAHIIHDDLHGPGSDAKNIVPLPSGDNKKMSKVEGEIANKVKSENKVYFYKSIVTWPSMSEAKAKTRGGNTVEDELIPKKITISYAELEFKAPPGTAADKLDAEKVKGTNWKKKGGITNKPITITPFSDDPTPVADTIEQRVQDYLNKSLTTTEIDVDGVKYLRTNIPNRTTVTKNVRGDKGKILTELRTLLGSKKLYEHPTTGILHLKK